MLVWSVASRLAVNLPYGWCVHYPVRVYIVEINDCGVVMRQFFSVHYSKVSWQGLWRWLFGSALLLAVVYYGGGRNLLVRAQAPIHLVVYAFSTQEEVLVEGIFPAFEQTWEAETERDLIIEGVFGPSGLLAGEINLGAPADVAIFSNLRNVNWLKLGKRLNQDAEPVMIGSTPLVIITRQGNPAGISDFVDLAQPGLQLLHADPCISGVGEWALLAEYGSAYLETRDQNTAETQLKDIWKNVRLVGDSARATLTLFELGAGDALVTYEQDVVLAQARGVPMEIIIPKRTILARHFAVILDINTTPEERSAADAFIKFLLSDQGQQIFRQFYLRPVVPESDVLTQVQDTFTEEDLGGWAQAYDSLIENLWKAEIAPNLKLEPAYDFLGVGQ